jgi:hypothetical protein
MLVENEGRTELWSAGFSSKGLLGQGEDKVESKTWEPLDYDTQKITFVDASIKFNFGLAITDKGELFGWGNNKYKSLGMAEKKYFWSPVEIPFFKDFYVHSFSCGEYHAIIQASPRGNMDEKVIFTLGQVFGVKTKMKDEDGILHLRKFNNIDIKDLEAGEKTTFIVLDGEDKPDDNVSLHREYTCEETNRPIKGTMHFYQDSKDEWHFFSEEGYNKNKQKIPEI